MTRIELPIRLRFLSVPTRWELRVVSGDKHHEACEFAFLVTNGSLNAFDLKERDAWACREEFLAIRANDTEGLRKFLEVVGIWYSWEHDPTGHWSKEVTEHLKSGNPVPLVVGGLWKFQASLRRSLLNKSAFKEMYAPVLGRPTTGLQFLNESREGIDFPLRVELTNAGAITLTDAYRMLLATVFFDVARGIRFKVCQRKDCKKPFPLTSKHKRKFCGWDCAHITTVRRNRPPGGGKQKARKPAC